MLYEVITIYNIITNAYKFTDENGKVTLSYKDADDLLEIKIADNGIGIEKQNISKIFDAYYSDDKHNKSDGLGLFLAKENIEKINGKISVSSELRKGSEFTISISKDRNNFV